ncbi:MAG: hypothetical protein OXG37_12285 [Actinomycetia bacterium]|nr:hypothetical protein [Actinomycetes bacterium]
MVAMTAAGSSPPMSRGSQVWIKDPNGRRVRLRRRRRRVLRKYRRLRVRAFGRRVADPLTERKTELIVPRQFSI